MCDLQPWEPTYNELILEIRELRQGNAELMQQLATLQAATQGAMDEPNFIELSIGNLEQFIEDATMHDALDGLEDARNE